MDGFSDAVSITAVSTNHTGLQPAKLQPCFLKRIFNYRRMITMKTNKTWKVLTALLLCALIVVGCLYALGVGWKTQPDASVSGEEMLSLWTEDAASKKALIEYIDAVTDEGGAEFIPVEKRVAVFDLDGTLFCETDPNYFDYCLLKYVDEFNAYIQEFKKQPMPSFDGMTRGDGWYLPMLQVIEYLKANDFTVYVVSGTDRFIVRGIVDNSPLGLPNGQIIGSDETLVAPDQGDTDGLQYVYDDDDKLVLGGEFIVKNLKMNKVTVIMQEIGVQPVLSFGNSTGDGSMAEYVTSGNPYKSLAFMLCCDDTERENGNEEKAQKMVDLCAEFDWVPVSMKNDWTTIYGDGVTKKAAQ